MMMTDDQELMCVNEELGMGKLDLIHKVTASPDQKRKEKKRSTAQCNTSVTYSHGTAKCGCPPCERSRNRTNDRGPTKLTLALRQVRGANATQARTNCQFVSRILIPLMTETTDVAGLNLSVLASPFLHLSRKT